MRQLCSLSQRQPQLHATQQSQAPAPASGRRGNRACCHPANTGKHRLQSLSQPISWFSAVVTSLIEAGVCSPILACAKVELCTC